MKRVASPGLMRDTGCLGLVHWDDPEGMVQGGRREKGSGWGTHVYLWRIHFDIWQNQYNIVKFKKKKKKILSHWTIPPQQSICATNWKHLAGSGKTTVKIQSLIKSSTSLVTGAIYNWIINLKVRINYKIRWVLTMTCQLWTLITISYCKVCKKTSGHRRPSLSSVYYAFHMEKRYKTLKMTNKDRLLAIWCTAS